MAALIAAVNGGQGFAGCQLGESTPCLRCGFGHASAVGMFDWYEPRPEVACPTCGSAISKWQGKSGPCALFVWRQGDAHPVDQPVDDDARIERHRYVEFTLPETFAIWGDCPGGHAWICECRCVDGTWELLGALAEQPAPRMPWER